MCVCGVSSIRIFYQATVLQNEIKIYFLFRITKQAMKVSSAIYLNKQYYIFYSYYLFNICVRLFFSSCLSWTSIGNLKRSQIKLCINTKLCVSWFLSINTNDSYFTFISRIYVKENISRYKLVVVDLGWDKCFLVWGPLWYNSTEFPIKQF